MPSLRQVIQINSIRFYYINRNVNFNDSNTKWRDVNDEITTRNGLCCALACDCRMRPKETNQKKKIVWFCQVWQIDPGGTMCRLIVYYFRSIVVVLVVSGTVRLDTLMILKFNWKNKIKISIFLQHTNIASNLIIHIIFQMLKHNSRSSLNYPPLSRDDATIALATVLCKRAVQYTQNRRTFDIFDSHWNENINKPVARSTVVDHRNEQILAAQIRNSKMFWNILVVVAVAMCVLGSSLALEAKLTVSLKNSGFHRWVGAIRYTNIYIYIADFSKD